MGTRGKVNLALGAFTLLVLLAPGGLVNRQIGQAWADWQDRSTVTAMWADMVSEGGQLGSGPIALVEFVDYECPSCRSVHKTLDALVSDTDITVVVRHLPLVRIHRHAREAAIASICAEEQGRFEQLHDLLLTDEEWMRDGDWLDLSREARIPDIDEFESCLESDRAWDRLDRDMTLARALGIEGTPGWVHRNGRSMVLPDASLLVDDRGP